MHLSVMATYLANGAYKKFGRDIFRNKTTITNSLGKIWQLIYNRCNAQTGILDPENFSQTFRRNELQRLLSVTNSKNETQRYDYLTTLNAVSRFYKPMGQMTENEFDRNKLLLSQRLPNGQTQTWERDYFGLILRHKNVLDQILVNTYNHARNLLSSYTTDSHNPDIMIKNIRQLFDEAGALVEIIDDIEHLTTRFRHDENMRNHYEAFIGADLHLHQAVQTFFNGDHIEEIRDTLMQGIFGIDESGNRVKTLASIFSDNEWHTLKEQWNTFDLANLMTICQGIVADGKVMIADNGIGTELDYDDALNRIVERVKLAGKFKEKILEYFDNDLLKKIQDGDQEAKHIDYDNHTARRSGYGDSRYHHRTDYNQNGAQDFDEIVDENKKLTIRTTSALNELDEITHQSVIYRGEGGVGYNDDLEFEHNGPDRQISKVSGTRTLEPAKTGDLSTHHETNTVFDANGYVKAILDKLPEKERHFITNCQGRIVAKWTNDNRYQFYFYTPDGQPIGTFGDIPPDSVPKMLNELPKYICFDLKYHAITETFPPPAPSNYVVQEGDTYESIAEEMFVDPTFADMIAETNGFSTMQAPTPGMQLQIPSLMQTTVHNWDAYYPTYNAAEVLGDFIPNLPLPQRNAPHPEVWKEVLEIGIGVAAGIAGGPLLAGAMVSAFGALGLAGTITAIGETLIGQGINYAFTAAVGAAISSATTQSTAVALGDQAQVDWNQVSQSAFNAIPGVKMTKDLHEGNPNEAMVDFLNDGMTIGSAMSMKGIRIDQMPPPGKAYAAAEAAASVITSAALSRAIAHTAFVAKDIAAQATGAGLGTATGMQAQEELDRAYQSYKDYKTQLAQREAYRASQQTKAEQSPTQTKQRTTKTTHAPEKFPKTSRSKLPAGTAKDFKADFGDYALEHLDSYNHTTQSSKQTPTRIQATLQSAKNTASNLLDTIASPSLLSADEQIAIGLLAIPAIAELGVAGIVTLTGLALAEGVARMRPFVEEVVDGISSLRPSHGVIERGVGKSLPDFASRELLESHFIKHGAEFKGAFNNPEEYLAGAHDVIKNGIKISYKYNNEIREGYIRFMGTSMGKPIANSNLLKPGNAQFEFVGTNNTGKITTYFAPSGKNFWRIINNNPVKQIITPYFDARGLEELQLPRFQP